MQGYCTKSRFFNLHKTNLKFLIIIQLQYKDWLSRQLVFQMGLSCVKRLKIMTTLWCFLSIKGIKGPNNTSILAPIKSTLLQFTRSFSIDIHVWKWFDTRDAMSHCLKAEFKKIHIINQQIQGGGGGRIYFIIKHEK